jgi:formate dehydrogenase maturation protein FdhE
MACPECNSYNTTKKTQYTNTEGNRVEIYECNFCEAEWKVVLKLEYFALICRGNV